MERKQKNFNQRDCDDYSCRANNRDRVSNHRKHKPSPGWGKTAGQRQAGNQQKKVGAHVNSQQAYEKPKASTVNVHPEKALPRALAPHPVGPMNWAAAVRGHPQPASAPQKPKPEPRKQDISPVVASSVDEATPKVPQIITEETAASVNVSADPMDQRPGSDSGLQPETEPQQTENTEQNIMDQETSLLIQTQKEELSKHVREQDEEIAQLKLELELSMKESKEQRKTWEEKMLEKERETERKLQTQKEELSKLTLSLEEAQKELSKYEKKKNKRCILTLHLKERDEEISQLKLQLELLRNASEEQRNTWEEQMLEKERETESKLQTQREKITNLQLALDQSKEQEEIRVQERERELKSVLQKHEVEISELKWSLDQSKRELQQMNSELEKNRLWMKEREEETNSLLQNQNKQITELSCSLGASRDSLQAREKQWEAEKTALLKEKHQVEAELNQQQIEFSRQVAQAEKEVSNNKEDLERKLCFMEQRLTRNSGIETELKLVKEQLRSRTEQFNLLVEDNANVLKLLKIMEDSHSYLESEAKEKQRRLERALDEAEKQLQAKDLEMEEERFDNRTTISTLKAALHQTEEALERELTKLRQAQQEKREEEEEEEEEDNLPTEKEKEERDLKPEKKKKKKDKGAQKKKGLLKRIKNWMKA